MKPRQSETIPVEFIEVGERYRHVSDEAVASLAASIKELGLRTPITVRYVDKMVIDGAEIENVPVLVAGNTRLRAVKLLGWSEIECFVDDYTETQARLWEIDENLCRAELTPAERAKHTAERKAIYEEMYPETRHGGDRKSDQVDNLSTRSFAVETALATGKDERTVRRDAERGEKVIDEVLSMIAGTKLDTGAYLDKLKKQPPNDQFLAAKRDLAILREQQKQAAHREKVKADRKVATAADGPSRQEAPQRQTTATAKSEFFDILGGLDEGFRSRLSGLLLKVHTDGTQYTFIDDVVSELRAGRPR